MNTSQEDPDIRLPAGGEAGQFIRQHHWVTTPLGPLAQWPQPLLTTLSIVLNSPQPLLLFWGGEYHCFYNEAFISGSKQAFLPGDPALDVWPNLRPTLDQVLTSGRALQKEDDLIGWNNYSISSRSSFCYSPVFDESGKPAGVLVICPHIQQADLQVVGQIEAIQKPEPILDNLTAHIAVLDLGGTILMVNEAWRRFCAENGGPVNAYLGSNYLLVCRQSGEQEGKQIAVGIEKVIRGEQKEFTLDYPCHSPTRQRWFRVRVTPVLVQGLITKVVVKHQDVTEKEINWLLMQKALHEKQKILDASLDMICTIDAQGRFVQISRACRDILGYEPQELLGGHFMEQVNPEDHPGIWEAADRLLAGEQIRHFENRYIRKDGSLVPMVWMASWDQEDQVFHCVGRDNTVRKQAEEQQKASNERITSILERITDGFLALDKEWRVTYWNPEAEQILRISKEQAAGKNLWAIFPEAIPLRFYSEYHRALAEQVAVHFEEYLPSIHCWLEVTAYPSEDGLSIYFKDITQRIEDQQALELSERRFKALVQEGSDLIAILDIEGNYLYVSPTTEKILGVSADYFIGKNVKDIIQQEDWEKVLPCFTRIESEKQIKLEPLRFVNAQNQCLWIENIVTDLTDDPAVGGIVINARDITQQKQQAQEREELIRELTLTNQDLRQFTYITSHNFRAPLSNLIGLLDLMQDIPIEDPLLQELLTGFQMSTTALNQTVNDLIDILIIKGSSSQSRQQISLREVFEKICYQIRIPIEESQAGILFDDSHASMVYFERSYLESIFLNLLTNAIKFRSHKRTLRIGITTHDYQDSVQLQFTDNGIGMDLNRYGDRLFGLYQRFHERPDSKGLGLYLVKSQIEALGGSIQVESKVDQGTTFTIQLRKAKGK